MWKRKKKTNKYLSIFVSTTNENHFHCSNRRYSLKFLAFVRFNSNSNLNPNWIQLFLPISKHFKCTHNTQSNVTIIKNQKPIPMGQYLIELKTEIEKSHAMSGNDRKTKNGKKQVSLKKSLANWALNMCTCLFWTQKKTTHIFRDSTSKQNAVPKIQFQYPIIINAE